MNRDVQRVRDLLGPADPALAVPVGPGDPTGLRLETEHDITPEGRAPVPRPRRAPRLALAGTFAAVLAVAGAVAVVTQLGSPADSPPGAAPGREVPCRAALTALADSLEASPADGQPGNWRHVRVTQLGYPKWQVSVQEHWMSEDGAERVTVDGGAPMDFPSRGGNPENPLTIITLKSVGALDWVGYLATTANYSDRAHRQAALRSLAEKPGLRCVADRTDPLGRTGLAVTAYAPPLGPTPASPLPDVGDCLPMHLSCEATLLYDLRTGELLAFLAPSSDPARESYTAFSDRSRADAPG